MPMGVASVFGVFDVDVLMCEPLELELRSKADMEFSRFMLPPPSDDEEAVDCTDGGPNELGVGGAYDGVNG